MPTTVERRERRERITTRIAPQAHETIQRLAELRRTTPSQVVRVLIEDAVDELAAGELARSA